MSIGKIRSANHLLSQLPAVCLAVLIAHGAAMAPAGTVALWLFDEQPGLYPSCVLGDASPSNIPLVLGSGGKVVEGKFGSALEALEQPIVDYPVNVDRVGLQTASRTAPPMTWKSARFCALMTRGENHLRQEVGFASPTRTHLNLGRFDWTVEFWYLPTRAPGADGVVFEVGRGPRGTNQEVTRLVLSADRKDFTLDNQPSGTHLRIASDPEALDPHSGRWHHLAFVYDSANGQLRHYVDGAQQTLPKPCTLRALPPGTEDYLSVGRDGLWERPLPGRMDELRFSDAQVYAASFTPPGSFSKLFGPDYVPPQRQPGPALLFAAKGQPQAVVPLAGRKYMFIDAAIVAAMENVSFQVNPPRLAERVLRRVRGHLVIFEHEDGLIRLYCAGPKRSLAVMTSGDGVHWQKPDLGRRYWGASNVVIQDPVGLGTLFLDPKAPPDERIKYFSGYRGRGSYIYSSADGLHFNRNETSALPFRGASQSIVYYDDQRDLYVGYHRSDMLRTEGGKTERTFVMTETADLMRPWPLRPVSEAEQRALAKERRLGTKIPYCVDNGPLTPPGFGVEYPTVFAPDAALDPVATDIYVPKNVKYPWAPDTYLAFPIVYFHYHGDGPPTRRILGLRERNRGSGPLETQLAVSRDGIDWQRYPRPAYIGIGRHGGAEIHKAYIAHGMVHRGDEIWQYYLGSEQYHSSWSRGGDESVYRVVQRFDGFVSADAPYTGGMLKTRPLTFAGSRLVLNIDTGATGYAQVGILDAHGAEIEGYGVDDCVYINGDFIATEVEWQGKGKDISALAGRPVRLVFRMRGTKLYTMQFVTP